MNNYGSVDLEQNTDIELEDDKKKASTFNVEDYKPIPTLPSDITYLSLFLMFLKFGAQAWGGPIAQIAMMKDHLVTQEQWVTEEQFNRVLAVYQVLPGPEATEMACYFGMLSRGRKGSVLAGLGFIIPGLLLMLLLSWFYFEYGLESDYIKAVFLGLQPAVAAMVFRAVHKIGNGTFVNHKTKQFNLWLLCIALAAAIQYVMGINFFITLVWCGLQSLFLDFAAITTGYRKIIFYTCSISLLAFGLAGYILYVIYLGKPQPTIFGANIITSNEWYNLLILGLLAGLLTFGGAYTAIPFVQQAAVIAGGWLTNEEFLDGIALASILPAPLVIFNTFVGYMGGQIGGALLMTFGVFLPAFSFTLIGHDFFEKITKLESVVSVLDGVTAGAVGIV